MNDKSGVFGYSKNNRPIADIIIQNGKHQIHLFPVIDSGEDITTIPKGIGEDLRLKQPGGKEIQKIRGIGGVIIKCVLRDVKIKLGDYHFFLKVSWLFENDGHALLGRDIFEKFDILFKQNPHKKIIFESDKAVFKEK